MPSLPVSMSRFLRTLLCRLLALLLFVNGAVVASEVSAHGLCDGHGEAAVLHLHGDDERDLSRGVSHGRDRSVSVGDHDGDHLCHAHPPLCAAAEAPLPLTAAAPTTRFAQLDTALHTRTFAPPVPPPNV